MIKKKRFLDESKKHKKIIVRVSILILLIIAVLVSIVQQKKEIQKEPEKLQEIQTTQEEVKSVYIAKSDIIAGEFAENTRENFISVSKNVKEIPEDAVTDLNLLKGKRLRKAISKDEVLQLNMLIDQNTWYESGDRFVEQQFMEGVIPVTYTNLVGNLVDIVLFRKEAPDPVVISKTVVVSATETRLGFNLNLEEREYLKEAAMEEGGFYLQIYLDENQEASPVSYEPTYLNLTAEEVTQTNKEGNNE